MRAGAQVAVVIPALNEEEAIGHVLRAVPDWVDQVIVADNGSTDRTPEMAAAAGAWVVREPRRGYGSACLAGMAALRAPDVVVFLDGDFSDYPEEMVLLVDPILQGHADMVVGSRVLGRAEVGALTVPARFGNGLTCALIRLFWRVRHTDLGPFRAIRYAALQRLGMRDRDYGWTVEMQIKAARQGMTVVEVPVRYRKRIGRSKISGTVRGVLGAGTKILWTVFRAVLAPTRAGEPKHRETLVIFTRYPEPGRTKTRLIPALGPRRAADLQRRMTAQTVATAAQFGQERPLSVTVCFEGGSTALMTEWLGPALDYRPQGTGDLGRRMRRALEEALLFGSEKIIIIGSDCPALTADHLRRAYALLDVYDLVLGPAQDGGYYLIGARGTVPDVFGGIPWGTGQVLEGTLSAADRAGLSVGLLEELPDVDVPEDVAATPLTVSLPTARKPRPSLGPQPRISVVIPVLNEAPCIQKALASAGGAENVELIVVDGGSTDATVQLAHQSGAYVLRAPACRSMQMNFGAAAASGEVLLFLHGDTRLPGGYDAMVRNVLEKPGIAAGAFRLGLDDGRRALRIVERMVNWRTRYCQMPYGDQAIFLRTDLFRRLRGFRQMPIMEDYELMKRLKRWGRIVLAEGTVMTSARRWRRLGVLRTTLVNDALVVAYELGLSPDRLARWYGRGTPSG